MGADLGWDVTVFTKNRERLLDGNIAEVFFQAVLQQARKRSLLSDEHFTVDGTLLEAWASVKSYQRRDGKNAVPPDDPGNATVDFHGEKRSNQTHASKTDPDAKMARKGKAYSTLKRQCSIDGWNPTLQFGAPCRPRPSPHILYSLPAFVDSKHPWLWG